MTEFSQLDEVLRGGVEAGEVPGVVAIAANRHGTLYEGAFGRRDLLREAPMTADLVFWIASMTKAITCTAALQLVETGRLSLDGPIGDLLPDLAAPRVLAGFDGSTGEPVLRPAARPITLRHLMTHTAGLCYDMWNADMVRYMKHADVPAVLTCRTKALAIPLVTEPGERWEYGLGIDLVGRAVEAASGVSLDAYFREHVLGPLGMADTGFRLGPDQRERLVSMHTRRADGSLNAMPFEVPQDPEFYMGGGGLYGTARDYIAFIRMLLNGGSLNGRRLLAPDSVRLLSENQIGDLTVTPMISALPRATNDVEFHPGMDKKWSLGFLLNTQATPEGRSAGSLAWAGLGNTYFWIDPVRDVGGVVLMQLLPFADAAALRLFGRFERGVYEALDRTQDAA